MYRYSYSQHVRYGQLEASDVEVGAAWRNGGDDLTRVVAKAQTAEAVCAGGHRHTGACRWSDPPAASGSSGTSTGLPTGPPPAFPAQLDQRSVKCSMWESGKTLPT